MGDFNHTDALILKLYKKGLTLERIAVRIGRPGNIQRVHDGLLRGGIESRYATVSEDTNVLPT